MRRPLKTLLIAALAVAGALAGGLAQARGNVYWSVDFAVPGVPVAVGGHVSNAPGMAVVAAPVVMAPQVVMAAPPVVYAPRPVLYGPPPVMIVPRPVFYGPPAYAYRHRGWRGHDHDRGRRYGPY